MNTIQIEKEGDVALLRLKRGKANAINAEMAQELLDALLELKTAEDVKAVVLCGHGHFFTAGLDVVELYAYNEQEIVAFWKLFDRLSRRLVAFPKPLVAAITGHSPAAGCVLALGCDYRIMAHGPYRIGLNEIPVGIVIPEKVFFMYGAVVGQAKAHQYLLEGKLHTTEEALACGLIDQLTEPEQVIDRAVEKARSYLKFNMNVWSQSKLNFRNSILQKLSVDFESAYEHTIKQWWSKETRQTLELMITELKKSKPES